MSYSTRAEVRDMVKDDALNAIIGDTFIEDPAEREELVSPIIDAAIADADAEIDGYLAKRYAVPLAPHRFARLRNPPKKRHIVRLLIPLQ